MWTIHRPAVMTVPGATSVVLATDPGYRFFGSVRTVISGHGQVGAGRDVSGWSKTFPEVLLAGVAFRCHFAWEMMRVPWFEGMVTASHGTLVRLCTRAIFRDVLILVIAFWLRSAVVRYRQWPIRYAVSIESRRVWQRRLSPNCRR